MDDARAEPLRRAWRARLVRSPGDALARLGLASIARLTYDSRGADTLYRPLLSSGGGAPDAIAAWARLGHASSLLQRWRSAEADTALTQARAAAEGIGDRQAEVQILVRLAVLRSRTEGMAAGLALIDAARTRLLAADTVGRAFVLAYRAQFMLSTGGAGARAIADSARALARATHLPRLEGMALQLLAREALRLGRSDSAIALFAGSAALLHRAGELQGYAVALQWNGYLLRGAARLAEATRDLERALAVGEVAGPLTLGWTHLNLSQIALTLGDWPRARHHGTNARVAMEQVGDQWGLATVLRTEAIARWAVHDWQGADSLYQLAERRLIASNINSEVQPVRVERLRLAIARRDWGAAEQLLVASRDTLARATASSRTDIDYYEALIALGRGQPDRATTILAGPGPDRSAGSYLRAFRRAEAEALLGHLDLAEASLRRAMDSLDAVRAALSTREARLAALLARGDLSDPDAGTATVIAALAAGGRVDAAFEFAERAAGRELLDAMLRREAVREEPSDRPTAREAAVARGHPKPIRLAELRAALPDSTALVQLVTGVWGEPTTAIVVSRERADAFPLPSADSLVAPVRAFVLSLQAGVLPRPLARQLGRQLLGPLLGALPAGVTRLIIVPGTPLHRVPFDALELPDGRSAIERFEISYAPSASVAALLRARPERATPGKLLVLGAPESRARTGNPVFDALAPLPGAEREVRRVASYFTTPDVRIGKRATEAALTRRSLVDVAVLHLATHAVVDPAALRETALLLASGDGDDGILRPPEIGALSLDADLVVLSSCRSAVTDGRYGDEGFRGLVAPLFEAGVRSVVGTAWPINDRAQIALVDRLYRSLAGGTAVGAAVREAKLAALHAGESPREWASLTVWGDALTVPRARMRRPFLPLLSSREPR